MLIICEKEWEEAEGNGAVKHIKIKESSQAPKIKSPSVRMPKELAKASVFKMKEHSSRISEDASDKSSQESPVEYASGRVESAEERIAGNTASAVSSAGKRMIGKSYERIRERGNAGWSAAENMVQADRTGLVPNEPSLSVKSDSVLDRSGSGRLREQQAAMRRTKLKSESSAPLQPSASRRIKISPRLVASSPAAPEQIRAGQAMAQKRHAFYVNKMTRQMAERSAGAVQETARAGVQSGKKAARMGAKGISEAVKAAVSTARSLWATVCAGGAGIVILFVIMLGVIGGFLFSSSSESTLPLSQEVLGYTPVIERYAQEYGIPEYVQVIQAIMMQESGGRGLDPMQASECPYNTRYPNSPNAITDPEYSIQAGIQNYAACVQEAGCTSPQDMDKLKLSLQGYNYGNGYISWAERNYGGYSEANARLFSQQQAASHGWRGYGDPEYVPHVLRYYSGGNLFAGLFGNSQMVSVAMSQLGNEGGEKFWSWYGFSSREEWCACFVSWCADQSGLIANGTAPRFSLCSDGMGWFQSSGKWQGNTYQPSAGTIIFFDWNGDGNPDHVGIVEKCENGRVYTIEGNSGNAVRQRNYAVGARVILGYGIISI